MLTTHGKLLRRAICTLVLALVAPAVSAAGLTNPEGEVLLTVTGAIDETNDGDAAVFDVAMLRAIDEVSFTTRTIWTEGPQTFTGVSLAGFLRLLGVDDGMLKASAINDYTVEIPVSDAVDGGPIIAYFRNGDAMSIRDKGPLWIVYPYDSKSDYKTEQVYARSIWQLDRIEVVD